MYREAFEDFTARLERDYEIGEDEIYEIMEKLSDSASLEDIIEQYHLEDSDLERLISHFGYNEPEEMPEETDRDDI